MNLKNILNFFGLWSYPLGVLSSGLISYLYQIVKMQEFILNTESLKGIALGGLIAPFFIMVSNLYDWLAKGTTDFTPNLTFTRDVTAISNSKKQAMHKKVGRQDNLLTDNPEGLVLGKQGRKFVRLPIGREDQRDGVSAVILGSPGAGKSVFLTNFLLINFSQQNPTPVFCLDIKPESARKGINMRENKNVKIVDFNDRNKAGWDVYYSIHEDTKEDEKMRVFDGISRSLIISSNPKDKFFVNNARTVLKFLLLYHFNKGLGFVDSITKVISEDIGIHIKNILNDKETCPENSLIYNGLKKYEDKDTDAMQDIILTLQEHLNIFLNSDVKYQLRDNPIKASPENLNEGDSIFVCLPMYLLSEYEDILRLITFQVISAMEKRGEDWKQPVVLILDELARLGRLENLLPFLAVNRSLGISILMAFQDLSQIEKIYSKEDARTFMNLSEVTCVLSCKDGETTRMLSDLIGDYKEEKVSHNRSAFLHCSSGKENVSNEYRKIMEVSDFQDLREQKESVIILYGKFFRIKQFRYYENPIFLKRYEEIRKANQDIDKKL
ncbi:MAG: type IV secretory system conjugative DNA transfer family protein [Lachnospiraceae bacterium]|nr:type IV secretory system conjugative DNA transfer family protein [Lachnospiraceae bacterium]